MRQVSSPVVSRHVIEHHHAGHDAGQRVGDAFAGDVGGGAVDGFEDGGVVADVGAGDDAQAADEAGAQVADQVAVEIFHQQHVEAGGVLTSFMQPASMISFFVLDVGIFFFVHTRWRSGGTGRR